MSTGPHSVLKPSVNHQKIDNYTFPLSNSIMLRVYSSTRPHNQKIANLQKGLILVVKGAEIVGEGTGFGLPILEYSSDTVFSTSSTVDVSTHLGTRVITKQFSMDRVARNSFRNITLESHLARNFIGQFSSLYQNNPHFRFLTIKHLTGKLGIGKTFLQTTSKGNITVIYSIDKAHVAVEADFTKVQRKGLQRIFMLNEQSAKLFRKYTDQKGAKLLDTAIGAWDMVDGEWACMKTVGDELGFRLWKNEGSILRRGREYLKDSLDWVGLDYDVNPSCDAFKYTVEIVGLR